MTTEPLPHDEVATELSRPAGAAPTVSVVVRTFNRPERLRRCLASLAAQRRTDFEVVVVNDAGLEPAGVAEEFRGRLRVRLLTHEAHRGRTAALNTGLAAARGRYLCFVDDDDLLYPNHLEELVDAVERLPAGTVVHSRALEATEDDAGAVLGKRLVYFEDFDPEKLLIRNSLPILSVLVPADVCRAVGQFDTRFDVLEDWEYWIRVAKVAPFSTVDLPTCEYRVRAGSANCTTRERRRFLDAHRLLFSTHPVADGTPAVQAREQVLRDLRDRDRSHPFPFSIVVAAGPDPARLLACLDGIMTTCGDLPYETIVHAPDEPALVPLLAALEGDVSVLVGDGVDRHEAWRRGTRHAVGRVSILLADDERLRPELLLAAHRAQDGAQLRANGSSAAPTARQPQRRVVVTGCGRSGTGYVSQVLTALGHPCGHEAVFNPHTDGEWSFGALQGDSSWMAVPYLSQLPQGTLLLHQVRHPLAVIRSCIGIRMLSEPSPYREFLERHCPEVFAYDAELERAMAYWVYWNRRVEESAGELRYARGHLERLDTRFFANISALLGGTAAADTVGARITAVPTHYNARMRGSGVSWDTLPAGALRDELLAVAARYGYDVADAAPAA
jgi:glycosyltransferase involved in cell wall biosynthesis